MQQLETTTQNLEKENDKLNKLLESRHSSHTGGKQILTTFL